MPHRIKFFASGEYGDKIGRPHYHALLFGVDHQLDAERIRDAWTTGTGVGAGRANVPLGFVDIQKCTPKACSYVAGYAAKKLGLARREVVEVVDPDTGEVVTWQEPFVLMSRGGRSGLGIGGEARDEHPSAWKEFVVHGGRKAPVPRYLHERWRRSASDAELEALRQQHLARSYPSRDELKEQERVALVRLEHKTLKRSR